MNEKSLAASVKRWAAGWRYAETVLPLLGLWSGLVLFPLVVGAQNPRAWGSNDFGQLGVGSAYWGESLSVPVKDISGVTSIAGGVYYSLALKDDGTVWGWGYNATGQLGNGTYGNSPTPVQSIDLGGVIAISAGGSHALALKHDGTVWAWGANDLGQLGNGSIYLRNGVPGQVSGLSAVVAIAAGGNHSLALKDDGTVWAWGWNNYGQLGIGTNTNSSVPVQVEELTGVTAIAGGSVHSLALEHDGTVWAWGWNGDGELGNGTNINSNVPLQVSLLAGFTVVGVAAGGGHCLALMSDGTLWAWGYNLAGQLGNGNYVTTYYPVQVLGLTGVVSIAAGGWHSLARLNDGTVWAWGRNDYGQCGNGTTWDYYFARKVAGLAGVTAIAGGNYHSLAVSNCPWIDLSPTLLPNGALHSPYSQQVTASGGTAPNSFDFISGGMPSWLDLSSDGLLSGTPLSPGTFTFMIEATDAHGCKGIRPYTLTIPCPTITLSPLSLPGGSTYTAYSQGIQADGGTAPYDFSVSSGALPGGLSLSTDGLLSGIPTAEGYFSFMIEARDALWCVGSKAYLVNISRGCPKISLSPSSLANGIIGTLYNQTIAASDGTAPYTFAVTAGTLPGGLGLSSIGVLSGTPTALGTRTCTVMATDANGCTESQSYTLTICCPTITLGPTSVPLGTAGVAYASTTFTQTGGVGMITWSESGTLPAGMNFSGGALSGTPTQTGSFPVTVTATDTNGCIGNQSYTLIISCPAITLAPSDLPNGITGVAYSQTVSATGGTGPYIYAKTSGTIPTGLSLASGGLLSGTPAAAGTYSFTVTATDANLCAGSMAYSITMTCPSITVAPASIPSGMTGVAYPSTTFTQTGGIGAITWSKTGTLPTGMSFANGILSGTPAQTGSFPFTIAVTDANGCTGSKSYSLLVVNPPVISLIKKVSPPFKLVVTGSNLQNGIKVFIDGVEWTSVIWKNTGKIQLKGAIKTLFPKGVTRTLRFVNPDGGEATTTWGR